MACVGLVQYTSNGINNKNIVMMVDGTGGGDESEGGLLRRISSRKKENKKNLSNSPRRIIVISWELSASLLLLLPVFRHSVTVGIFSSSPSLPHNGCMEVVTASSCCYSY